MNYEQVIFVDKIQDDIVYKFIGKVDSYFITKITEPILNSIVDNRDSEYELIGNSLDIQDTILKITTSTSKLIKIANLDSSRELCYIDTKDGIVGIVSIEEYNDYIKANKYEKVAGILVLNHNNLSNYFKKLGNIYSLELPNVGTSSSLSDAMFPYKIVTEVTE